MRKQYYFRPSDRGLLAWDVDRLVQLSGHLPRKRIPLSEIRELDEVWFGEDERPSWRSMLEHLKLIDETDLSFPIILSASGAVMDGMHRVAKDAREAEKTLKRSGLMKTLSQIMGLGPDELPYWCCRLTPKLSCER